MHFQVQSKTAFHIPLSVVSNSNIAGKNEVAVEFAPSAIAPPGGGASNTYREPDELVEMRFYIPGMSKKKGRSGEDGENDEDEDDDEDEVEVDAEGKEVTAAEAVHRKIQEHADIRGESGDSLVVFEDILVLTPRYVSFIYRFCADSALVSGRLLGGIQRRSR
jgi:structure-specific recognition protein 1